MIWIVPLVAALLGLWLAVTTLREQGPTISISFQTADGLEAGKTKIKYKDVEIGVVSEVQFSDNFSNVVAIAKISKAAAGLMVSGTRFWIVRPQLGLSGVSGLGTLLSGSFIEIDAGTGQSETAFVGLEEPPPLRSDMPGRRFVLHSKSLGSIGRGAPVNYRGIAIGKVLDYRLDKERSGLSIDIFVNTPYDDLIRKSSRFWNASGINVSIGGDGVEVKLASLRSMLIGGIDVETPDLASPGQPSEAGDLFELYDSHNDVIAAGYTERIPVLAYFRGSVRGLKVGAPVEFSGMQVGMVTSIDLEFDPGASNFKIRVGFDVEPNRVRGNGPRLVAADPSVAFAGFVERGLRAQLQTGNILTGELIVALTFVPGAPAETLKKMGTALAMPTIDNDMEQMTRSAQGFIDQLARLDLPALVGDLRKTVQGVNMLVASPEARDIIVQLAKSMDSVERITGDLEGETGPLVTSLRRVADNASGLAEEAESFFKSAHGMIDRQSPIRADTEVLMKELISATRSIRLFADYLDRHPEALLRGKAGAGQ